MTELEIFNESGQSIPLDKNQFENIISKVSEGEKVNFTLVEIVYVDETGIQNVNTEYLGRDYITDIITFNYTDDSVVTNKADIEGTIYMCPQRIIEQAKELNVEQNEEFKRIFIHGLLHLCGYNDDTKVQKLQMTKKEDQYLAQSS